MAKYYECPICGANLDFGEKCDCMKTKEKIENLYEKTMSLLDEKKDDNKTRIEKLLLSANKGAGMKQLVDHMEERGFFKAPCSGANHLSEESGLAKHSLNVYEYLLRLNESMNAGLSKNSMIVVALLHDLGKMGDHNKPNYVPNMVRSKTKNKETGEYDLVQSEAKPFKTNSELTYEEHEIRSLLIAERYIELTEDEETAILHHNGCWGKLDSSYSSTFDKHKLATLLHFADLWCSRFVEVEEGK